jgi:hypothetical protein
MQSCNATTDDTQAACSPNLEDLCTTYYNVIHPQDVTLNETTAQNQLTVTITSNDDLTMYHLASGEHSPRLLEAAQPSHLIQSGNPFRQIITFLTCGFLPTSYTQTTHKEKAD